MFFIKAMGCDYHHEPDFYMERERGTDGYLMLFLKSRCLLPRDGEMRSFPPYTFILFNQNSPHCYGADGEEYLEDWIQFECDPSLIERHGVPFDTPVTVGEGVGLEKYFSLIRDVYFRCLNDIEILDHLMMALLGEVGQAVSAGEPIPHFKELMELKGRIYADPGFDWSVDVMAERLHVSAPYMQELYKKAFHLSCMKDVIAARISYAQSLLTNSDLSIEEIARMCGYKSVVHFSRQFKKETGPSPSAWRRRLTQGE